MASQFRSPDRGNLQIEVAGLDAWVINQLRHHGFSAPTIGVTCPAAWACGWGVTALKRESLASPRTNRVARNAAVDADIFPNRRNSTSWSDLNCNDVGTNNHPAREVGRILPAFSGQFEVADDAALYLPSHYFFDLAQEVIGVDFLDPLVGDGLEN